MRVAVSAILSVGVIGFGLASVSAHSRPQSPLAHRDHVASAVHPVATDPVPVPVEVSPPTSSPALLTPSPVESILPYPIPACPVAPTGPCHDTAAGGAAIAVANHGGTR